MSIQDDFLQDMALAYRIRDEGELQERRFEIIESYLMALMDKVEPRDTSPAEAGKSRKVL